MQNFSRLEWIFYILAGFFKTLAARGASSLFQAIKTAKEIFWKVCSNKFVLGEQSFSDFPLKQLKIPLFYFKILTVPRVGRRRDRADFSSTPTP